MRLATCINPKTITSTLARHFTRDNNDNTALDTDDLLVANPSQEPVAVATPHRTMSNLDSQEQEQASLLSHYQHDDRERLLQLLQQAAQSVAGSANAASPLSSTVHLHPTGPTALKEDQPTISPPSGSTGPSSRLANAPIAASAAERAESSLFGSLYEGWVPIFKCWAGVTLTPLHGLLRFILLYCLPVFFAALLGPILCLFVIILLWNAVLFTMRALRHNVCSAGLSNITPWLSAPVLGLGDFCSISKSTEPAGSRHVLGDDPSGVMAMTSWDVSGSGLVVARNMNAQISTNIAQLVADTELWQDQFHGGEQIHKNVLDYSYTHTAAEDQLESLFSKHTDFIQSLLFEVQFLSHHVQAKLKSHDGGWSWSNYLASWISQMPILRAYTPLGMLQRDFRTFAEHHRPKLEELKLQAGYLLEALKKDQGSRKTLNTSIQNEWRYFEKECLSVGPAYLWGLIPSHIKVVGEMPYCHEWDHMELRTLLQTGIGNWTKSVEDFAAQSRVGYVELRQHYANVVSDLKNGRGTEDFGLDSTMAYGEVLKNILRNMMTSMDKLQAGLDGQVIRPISDTNARRKVAQFAL